MTEKELGALIAAAVQDKDLTDTDIPAIDLYLDQILSLVADKNKDAAPRYRERALTKTMINNYSKDGLISPITGKKYTKEHIIEMLLVYALKNTLSIGEIKRVLTGARNDCAFTGADMTEGYRRFLAAKETNRARVGEIVLSLLREDELDVQNDRDFFVALLDILSLSAYLKTVAQEMLEARYSDPDEAERERREREKNEKREREDAEKQKKREREEAEKAEKRERSEREREEKRKEKNRVLPDPAD
ncbi:MAG: DUF1836 domain-containing protein [Clostridia bacterium]|nr:DUF1836 domain-containing protein [Clostridia bacterium]